MSGMQALRIFTIRPLCDKIYFHKPKERIRQMRINKYIAQAGIASRRKADELILNGNVKVNGAVMKEPGYDVADGDKVEVNGRLLESTCRPEYVLVNKPLGMVTTVSDDKDRLTVMEIVKDRLKKNALGLSGGQQQRLYITHTLAVEPKVLLMDEPTSALDPISTSRIEELALQLKEKYTIIIVTHNMQQAVRISDSTAFFLLGELVEFGETEKLFSQPVDKRTEDYITGRFG